MRQGPLPDFEGDREAVTQYESPSPLNVGDKVSYQGDGRFCLRSWTGRLRGTWPRPARKYVKPGDVGVVVEQGTDTRPWCVKPGGESPWWKVDFGEGRVVTVSNYDLQIGQYRHEGTKAF